MVPLGISGAAATRVGNAIGRGDLPGGAAGGGGLPAARGGRDAGLRRPVRRPPRAARPPLHPGPGRCSPWWSALLPIAAVFQVFDGLQVVSAGVLRGAADTTFPAAMALIGYWALALPVGWYLAFRAGLGARGLWWGFVVGLMVVAILLLLRIAARFRGPRRSRGRSDLNEKERNRDELQGPLLRPRGRLRLLPPQLSGGAVRFRDLPAPAGASLAWDCATGNGQAAVELADALRAGDRDRRLRRAARARRPPPQDRVPAGPGRGLGDRRAARSTW